MNIDTFNIASNKDTLVFLLSQKAEDAAEYNYSIMDNFLQSLQYNIILLFIIIVLFSLFFKKIRDFISVHLKVLAFLTLASGFSLYIMGFNYEGCRNDSIALFFRSLLSSLEMFASHSDLLEVKEECKNDYTYMLFFSITHFTAVFISAFFIIKVFGYRLYSWTNGIYMRFMFCFSKTTKHLFRLIGIDLNIFNKDKHLYVFWGVNDNSITLAESIKENVKKGDADIIFIALPNDNKRNFRDSRFTFTKFFHYSSDSINSYIDRIERIDAMIMNVDYSINADILSHVKTSKDFYTYLELENLGKIVKNYTDKNNKISYFFLSDNENQNIVAVSTFKKLNYQKTDIHHKGKNFNIYCNARRNHFNIKILIGKGLDYKIHLIDTSYLAMKKLKTELRHQPISFVLKDNSTGRVLSPFKALILGFGKEGRDALRFMYEFSSFIDKDGNENERKFYIWDKDLEKGKYAFLNSAPALKDNDIIEWMECKSDHNYDLWEKLKYIINDLNCIYICIGNDEESKLILGQIYEFSYRYRKDFERFGIYIKISDKSYMEQIEDFNINNKTQDLIFPYGTTESIFNYEVFTSGILETEAKLFYYKYKLISSDLINNIEVENFVKKQLRVNDTSISELQKIESNWEYRRMYKDPNITINKENEKTFDPYVKRNSLEDFIEVQYQEAQDMSNAWHIKTKMELAGINKIQDEKEKERRLNELAELAAKNWKFCESEKENNKDCYLIDSLNGCEHIRWNSKMQLLGFVYKPRPETISSKSLTDYEKYMNKTILRDKTLRERTHHCIVSFKKLKSDNNLNYSIDFDQNVVRLSFILYTYMQNNELKSDKNGKQI